MPEQTELLEKMYSPRSIAALAGIGKAAVLKLIRTGVLQPVYKPFPNVIRVPASSVNAWLRAARIK